MPQRIVEYCLELMDDTIKNSIDKSYPTIVPIVLYTGKGKWNVETNFAERQKYSIGTYEEYKIDIKYKVIDINTIKNMKLLEKQDYLANIMLMEKCKTDEERIKMLEKIYSEMKSKEEQEKIFYYFINLYEQMLKPEDKKRLREYLERSENKMTALQKYMIEERVACIRESRAEGMKRGRAEGMKRGKVEGKAEVAKNLLKLKIPIQQIIEATGLSKEKVEELSKDLLQKASKKN